MVSVLFYKIVGTELRCLVLEGAPWWQRGLSTGERLPPYPGWVLQTLKALRGSSWKPWPPQCRFPSPPLNHQAVP